MNAPRFPHHLLPDQKLFIRQQSREAVPLLAELYSLTKDQVAMVRDLGPCRNHGEAIPLKLLRELVDQRREKLSVEQFVERESSIVQCEAFR